MRSGREDGAASAGRRGFLIGAAAAASALGAPGLAARGLAAQGLAARGLAARGLAAYPPPDRALMVPVRGGRIYVRVNGPLDGPVPPILMISDGPGRSLAGLVNALALADERAVILYDQLDSGRSDHPNDPANWTVERFTDEVEAVRRALGVTRWHVFGHGWGGTLALEYGARRPAELAGLVLASPWLSARSWVADSNALRRQLPAEVQAVLTSCNPPGAAPIARPRPPSAMICRTASEAYDAAFNRRAPRTDAQLAFIREGAGGEDNQRVYVTMRGPSEFVAGGTLSRYDGAPLLSKLDGARTLFMAGQFDRARPDTLAAFAARVPHGQMALVRGAAHEFMSDQPEAALAILRPWLWTQE